jgi:hypothetical protein
MNNINTITESYKKGLMEVSEQALKAGIKIERERLIKAAEAYFDLTQEPNEDGSINQNPEWDRGYQAALAILRGSI